MLSWTGRRKLEALRRGDPDDSAKHRGGLSERGGHVVAVSDERDRTAAEAPEPLGERQAVGQRLAGMFLVGQRVDDLELWSGVGERFEARLRERAHDRDGDPALEVPRHVSDGLSSAERNIFGRLDGVAAEFPYGDLKRRPRPERRFLEEERDVQPVERLLLLPICGTRRLELGCPRQARSQLRRTEVEDRQEPCRYRRADSHPECGAFHMIVLDSVQALCPVIGIDADVVGAQVARPHP